MPIPAFDIFSTTGGRIHGMKLPIIIYGPGSSLSIARAAASIGVRDNLLLLTDRQVRWLDRVRTIIESLRTAGLNVTVDADRSGQTSVQRIQATAAAVSHHKAEAIIAIGGGSVIDEAKGAAVTARYKGLISDYDGRERVPGPTVPVIAVPTTAGSGSELLPWIVIPDTIHTTLSVIWSSYLQPLIAVIDPNLTITLPFSPTACAGTDALAHAVEAFITARTHPLVRWQAAGALRLIMSALPSVINDGSDSQSREQMMMGQLLAGSAAANSSLTAIHSLSYSIAPHLDLPHARFIGHLLTAGLNHMRSHLIPDLAALARLILTRVPDDDSQAADLLINRIEQTVSACGIKRLSLDSLPCPAIVRQAQAMQFTADSPGPPSDSQLTTILTSATT